MSGGFFRGTSADQDTRFSNKQAKLMKSQKFAPELEHLVDMTKVKMDVMRPWIAEQATELLGFEDEVLINFIYGLLDGKVVNGKEIQISLTGFMEKNTGKFMKELWLHLLSAQKNASGVPQQFLDAKEEETRKKKAETDRITNEIQKKKEEGREYEKEKVDKTDAKADNLRANNDDLKPSLRHHPRASSTLSAEDERGTNGRVDSRGRSRVSRSPHSVERSSSSHRVRPSRSISKSSNSRSYSDERGRSRSKSISPRNRGRSISSERIHRSPLRRLVTPRRKDSPRRSFSPSRRRPYYFRQRSTSRSHRRSRSPIPQRLRFPIRGRSRSPIQCRSRTPLRHRSRSPMRYRSRSPIRRRSRSPVGRRSPFLIRHQSPSTVRRWYRRSSSTPRRRSPSPMRRRPAIPVRRRSPSPLGSRSSSPEERSSHSPIHRTPLTIVGRRSPRQQRSPVLSSRERIRTLEKYSPVRHAPPRENFQRPFDTRKGSSLDCRPPMSLRSPQRKPRNQNNSRNKIPSLSPSPYNSPSGSESSPPPRKRSPSENRRSSNPFESPVRQTSKQITHDVRESYPRNLVEQKPIPDRPLEKNTNYTREDEDGKHKSSRKKSTHSTTANELEHPSEKVKYKDKYSLEGESQSFCDNMNSRNKDQQMSELRPQKVLHSVVSEQEFPTTYKGTMSNERVRDVYGGEVYKAGKKSHSHTNSVMGSGLYELEALSKLTRKVVECGNRNGSDDSVSGENEKHKAEVDERRKHKKSKWKESDDVDSYDSQPEGRKEAKRRRKEERRLRKVERRKRREERHRRREEQRSGKLKLKSVCTVSPPSNLEQNHDGYASDGERVVRKGLTLK